MTQDLITQIPLAALHESPFNARQVYTQARLQELADNIKAEGRIHEPLLVRPRRVDEQPAGFELVFGHRRLRAAALAGLDTAPCMVRAMTDAEVRSAQAAENLQRENLQALEEAQGYADMMAADGLTVEQVAQRVGKSISHVYARKTLLLATATIRAALITGEIGSETALLIARLRTEKLQQKALAAIQADTNTSAKLDDGGKRSYRHIRDLLAEKFTLGLNAAIFDREDPALLPGAGVCSACPKRTGNAPEYADLAPPNREGMHRGYTVAGGTETCTDPDCFAAKKDAHLKRDADKLRAAGKQVVDGNKARQAISAQGDVKGDFIHLDDVMKLLKAKPKGVDLNLVSIQNQRTGKFVKAVKRSDMVAAGLLKPEQAKATKPDHQAQYREQEKEHQRRAEQAKSESHQRMALLRHVREVAATRPRNTFELRLVASAALAGVPWNHHPALCELHGVKSVDALKKKLDTLHAAELTVLLMDCILVDYVRGPLLALATHYGINARAVMQASVQPAEQATPTPSPAGASAKKAGAGAKKSKAPAKVKRPAAKYRCAATGQTWSGKGLQPKWLKVALERGKTLADFQGAKAEEAPVKTGQESRVHDKVTADLFKAAGA